MTATVRTFQKTTEPSFPDNDALPKKKEGEKKFDKKFNEWWEEVRINLSKLEEQMTKYISKDLQDGLTQESQRRVNDLVSLDEQTTQTIGTAQSTIESLTEELAEVKRNLYSE